MSESTKTAYSIMQDKIGNFIVAFCQGKEIHLSSVLKFLYLLDETSVKEKGVPITFLQYYAYERGPVAKEILELIKSHGDSGSPSSHPLSQYINTSYIIKGGKRHYRITPKTERDDMTLTKYELRILNDVILKYGHLTGNKLSELTHEKDSLWDKVITAFGLTKHFKETNQSRSDKPITFDDLLDTPDKKQAFESAKYSFEYTSQF